MLKVRFAPDVASQNSVAMQVLYQDEGFTNWLKSMHTAPNGFRVLSQGFPELGSERVLLRGTAKDKDLALTAIGFSGIDSRYTYLDKLKDALKWAVAEYKKSLAAPAVSTTDNDPNVETFA